MSRLLHGGRPGKSPASKGGLLAPFVNGVKRGVTESGKHKAPTQPGAGKQPVTGGPPAEKGVVTTSPPGAGGGGGTEVKGSDEKGETMGINFEEDQSLQRWGRNLEGLDEYASEVASAFARAEEAAEKYRQVARKISEQAGTELPASPRLIAEVESVAERSQHATSADDWKAVAADAGTLPTLYRMEHETDEDRMNNPRVSHQAEMRADVSSALQDN